MQGQGACANPSCSPSSTSMHVRDTHTHTAHTHTHTHMHMVLLPSALAPQALLALSALVRHFAPGLKAFWEAGGVASLVAMCSDVDSRVQR